MLEILPFSYADGKTNMERDLLLARKAVSEGKFFLRWYGWRGLTLSFGYSQRKLMEEFDNDLPKVLRPTGGGILLHGWDISFSVATPGGFFRSILHLYRFVAESFVETFRRLGIKEVDYSRNKKGNYLRRDLCWLVPTYGEVVFKGKKLVAAAVREVEKENYLIHGSIYIHKNGKILKRIFSENGIWALKNFSTLSEIGLKKNLLMASFNNVFSERLNSFVGKRP